MSKAESRVSGLDRSIARAALLPNVTYHNQALYTQPLRSATVATDSPRFIANNGVREYVSQGVVNETLGLQHVAALRGANAEAARAEAETEIARRGLVAAVVNLYYGVLAADQKLVVAQRAVDEANSFTDLTGKRERAREAAHADVVKAQLQQQQRQRDLSDAQLAREKTRLELGILLFADPRTEYAVQPPDAHAALPARTELEAAVAANNPELRSALAALKKSDADVLAARGAYLPELGLSYSYGIDSPQFAVNGPAGERNLGYAASVTLDIPVWDWLSTQHKVKQSEIRREATRVALTAAQRNAIAQMQSSYAEAEALEQQQSSLATSATAAQESLRLTKLRYTGGEATVLEMVDAQNTLVQMETARAEGAVRYQAALANLQILMGRL